MNLQELDIASLTSAEKLLLVDRLLDGLFCETIDEPFTPEQLQMIDERLKAIARLRSGQTNGLSWDGAMQALFPHAEDETFSREDMQKLEELLQEAFDKRL